jgi:phosphatidylserine/phosphatidylglycerophosphate/cardiolipin synthase-like enzyme
MLIVDGKTVVAAGYNMTYEHYIQAHPSGRGAGWNDLGIQVTGPVAQDAVLAFDDLWVGSDQRHCTNFYPAYGVWQASCYDFKATGQHVPEVMRYYVTEGKATAFSMFRSNVRDEADRQIADALAAAEESIDTMQVNFTMGMICDLDILYDVCTFDEALPFMDGLVTAAENGAHVRILFKGAPIDGIENNVAANILEDEIARRGLEENFELRYFDGPMHYKAINIDNELVIVGSQNFHYSAFAPLYGLTEYNLGVVDERAAENFGRLFEYHWQRGIPRETMSEQ